MTWTPTEKEIATLITSVSDTRYAYFIQKVTEAQQVWSLRDDEGWRVVADEADRECLPVWPHDAYARLCATEEFKDSSPAPIPLEVFMTRWLPGMARDRRFVAVFPTPGNKGVVVAPAELRQDLEDEAARYG